MLKSLTKSEFSKNVLILLTGTSIAQLIPIMMIPILGRLFTPEEFGIFAFYFSIVSILTIFATGRYDLAILLPKEDKKAVNIMALSFIILGSYVTLISLLGLVLSGFIFSFPKIYLIGNWLYLVPILVFFTSSINILTAWNNRKKMFAKTSISKIMMYSGEGVSTGIIGIDKNAINYSFDGLKSLFSKSHVVVSKSGWSFHGLILGRFFGLLLSFIYLVYFFFKNHKMTLGQIDKQEMKLMAKEHRDFPRINMWHAASDELKTSGLSFLIMEFFLEATLGFYNMTYRILRAPLSIIGSSFSQVFFQKAAEKYAHHELLSPFIKSTSKKLFLIALPIFTLIFFGSPIIFKWVLGEKWAEAGIYAQYLTPWLFVNFIISPISQVAIILKKQFAFWMINILNSSLIFIAILLSAIFFDDIKIGFIMISISQVIMHVWIYYWIISTTKKAEASFQEKTPD